MWWLSPRAGGKTVIALGWPSRSSSTTSAAAATGNPRTHVDTFGFTVERDAPLGRRIGRHRDDGH